MARDSQSVKTGDTKAFRRGPDFFRFFCGVAAVATVATLAWMIGEIAWQSWPSIQKFGLGFIVNNRWMPSRDIYGVLPFFIGTGVTSLIAILISLPLGLAIAIFLSENFLPPPIRQTIRFTVEMLAAIPSVVYGLWGIFVVIPIVREFGKWALVNFKHVPVLETLFAPPAYGTSTLTASLVLALMILPTITAISRAALVAVPSTLREGSYALGATRWETIFRVLLPAAAPGIVAASILALGRAMGETMAVAMLIGNSTRLTWSLLSPSGTLASLLANQFGEASGLQVNSLMYTALLLMLLTLAVNMAGEVVLRYTQRQTAGIR